MVGRKNANSMRCVGHLFGPLLADSGYRQQSSEKFSYGSTAAKGTSMDAGSGLGQKAVIQVA
jgi:hypothetical protein